MASVAPDTALRAAQVNANALDGSLTRNFGMIEQEYWRYNLPGFGMIRVRLFPSALRVYRFLEEYGHVEHLKSLDQLGPIRQVLPGAHHTRYEYLMAQWAIITELCHLKGQLPAGLSLGTKRTEFGSVSGATGAPTNGEILMVLALLGNIGHVPTTFSGERAYLKYLRDRRYVRAAFRAGLPKLDRERFDAVIERDNLYQFNYYIAAFLLNRYRRRADGGSIVDFCQAVLRSFITTRGDSADQSLVALWSLYRSLRRLTYLALDSHYAPVPFTLDLSSIFFSLDSLLSDVFLEASSFQEALQRFEGVLRDTVYMGAEQMVNHARVSDIVLDRLERETPEPASIGALWEILGPDRSVGRLFSTPPVETTHGSEYGSAVQISYDLDPVLAPVLLPDPIAWERSARAASGLRSCIFAADFDPPRKHLKITAALSKGIKADVAQKAAHRVSKQLIDFEATIAAEGVQLSAASVTRNGLALLRFILPMLFGRKRRVRLRTPPAVEKSPIIRTTGSTRAAGKVREYRDWAAQSGFVDADELIEIDCLEETLRTIDYRGALLAYAGSTEVIEAEKVVAEFDGLAVLLSRDLEEPTLILVEAKNFTKGNHAAKKQLEERLKKMDARMDGIEIHKLSRRGAYAAITVASLLPAG